MIRVHSPTGRVYAHHYVQTPQEEMLGIGREQTFALVGILLEQAKETRKEYLRRQGYVLYEDGSIGKTTKEPAERTLELGYPNSPITATDENVGRQKITDTITYGEAVQEAEKILEDNWNYIQRNRGGPDLSDFCESPIFTLHIRARDAFR